MKVTIFAKVLIGFGGIKRLECYDVKGRREGAAFFGQRLVYLSI